jgi:hypothetical protein
MTNTLFDEIETACQAEGPAAGIEKLIAALEAQKDWHHLFDALLMRKKLSMGLPTTRPTAFDDVPEPRRDEFEQAYMEAARWVGECLLGEGNIAQAWMYFRTIREPGPVAAAIEKLPVGGPVDEQVLEIALFQGAAPAKGVEMMLASHGTCSTITALDQQLSQMPDGPRRQCAALMVQRLYRDLRDSLEADVKRRQPMLPPGQSIRELIAGRDQLFENDNYHVDVSHLNAVVRMARELRPGDVELKQALQLAQYGARLASQYQYAGTPPFTEFYPTHQRFFRALLGDDVDEALDSFRSQLTDDVSDTNNKLTALTLVDLYEKLGRTQEAIDLAVKYLAEGVDGIGFSVGDLCLELGRIDVYKDLARKQDNLIAFTSALCQIAKTSETN